MVWRFTAGMSAAHSGACLLTAIHDGGSLKEVNGHRPIVRAIVR
jgi:hypothetical protein